MKIGVKVMPRNEVLDSQGRTVAQTLKSNGQPIVACRVGKFIELELEGANRNDVRTQAQRLAETFLCNPLIESFELVDL